MLGTLQQDLKLIYFMLFWFLWLPLLLLFFFLFSITKIYMCLYSLSPSQTILLLLYDDILVLYFFLRSSYSYIYSYGKYNIVSCIENNNNNIKEEVDGNMIWIVINIFCCNLYISCMNDNFWLKLQYFFFFPIAFILLSLFILFLRKW